MKKSIFAVAFMVTVLFSCTKESEDFNNDNLPSLQQKSTSSVSSDILSHSDFQSLVGDFEMSVLTSSEHHTIVHEDYFIHLIPVRINQTKSDWYLMALADGESISRVVLIDESNWNSGEVRVYFHSANIYQSYRQIVNPDGYYQLEPAEEGEKPVDPYLSDWWACLTTCFHTAYRECDANPECFTMCYLAGAACEAAMYVSCFIGCTFLW